MAAIETTNLTKQYGGMTAVSDRNLIVEEGGVFGFLGSNSDGKSPAINVLLGFLKLIDRYATMFGNNATTETTTDHVRSLSPTCACFSGIQPVYADVANQNSNIQANYGGTSGTLPRQPWYNVLVMLGWSAISLTAGFLKFRNSELIQRISQ